MRSRVYGRALPVGVLHKGVILLILLGALVGLAAPIEVLAYRESAMELAVWGNPGVLVQNQSYSTSVVQNLFHTATSALSDTEAFDLSSLPPSGIQLAQTVSTVAAGTETGFYSSTASTDFVPPVHIGNGFLGTWIGDPLWTGTPVFAGLIFPQMTAVSPTTSTARLIGTAGPGNVVAAKNSVVDNEPQSSLEFQPVINNELNTTATETGASAPNATSKATPTPGPAIKPGDPLYHQQNKPFSTALTYPSGPFKATPQKVENTTAFDRLLMNTVGRSTTDKAFNGTTSSPTYITPGKAWGVQIPYDFIQGALGMTMPGTHLNYRAWPL